MTTQDYINAEIQHERDARAQAMAQSQRAQAISNSLQRLVNGTYGSPGPSEVILLRAKVRELTDKLAAETERCVKIAERNMHTPNEDDGGYGCDCEECRVRRGIAAKIRSGQ